MKCKMYNNRGKQIDGHRVQYNVINDARDLVLQMNVRVYVSLCGQDINLIIFPKHNART